MAGGLTASGVIRAKTLHQLLVETGTFGRFTREGARETCFACQDHHSFASILPIENGALSPRSHAAGLHHAQVMVPANHTFHYANGEESRCAACRMPTCTSMARNLRRDHLFPFPGPPLSQELGIPNTCTNCHADPPPEWAIEAPEHRREGREPRNSTPARAAAPA